MAGLPLVIAVPLYYSDPVEHAVALLQLGASYEAVAEALVMRGAVDEVKLTRYGRGDPRWPILVRLRLTVRSMVGDWWHAIRAARALQREQSAITSRPVCAI